MKNRTADWLLGAGLLAATLCVYQPAWQGTPLFDDENHLTQPVLRSLEGLGRIWTQPGATQQYYPVTFTAFWVEHRFWGDRTLGYHLVNICLHCVSALLFLAILRRLEVPGAWLAAGIFALHPVHVESVAWMTQLKSTLSGVFCLVAALVYLGFDRMRSQGTGSAPGAGAVAGTPSGRNRAKTAYALALGLFVVGLLAKTAIVTLPAALLVVFWWKRGKLSWKGDVLPLAPFFAAGMVAGLVTIWVEQRLFGAEGAEFRLTFGERCLVAGRAVWFHLGKLCWPADLRFMYPRWTVSQAAWWEWLLYPGGLALVVGGLWGVRRWSRGPLAALLLFVGMLFPTLGFFNAYTFRYCFVNNHYQYLASLGMIALFSAGATLGWARWLSRWRASGSLLCLVLLGTLATLSWRQCRMFSDVETLWRTTLARDDDCFLAHNNVGCALLDQGRVDEALAHFQRALRACPDFPETHNNLGNALCRKGRPEEAIAHYEKALQIQPRRGKIYSNLGSARLQMGQVDEAIDCLQRAVELAPGYADCHNNLGSALLRKGRLEEAIAAFQRALELQPRFPEARRNLGGALLQQGQGEEALTQLREALALRPDWAAACFDLGNALLENGQMQEAIGIFQRAVQIDPTFAAAHSNLGNALLRTGQTAEALAQYRAAIQAEPGNAYLLNNLAWVLATSPQAQVRDGVKAAELAQQAERISGGKEPLILGTLAAAYAEAGRFTEAVATAQRALELAAAQTNAAHVNILRAHIQLYEAHSPFRDVAQTNSAVNATGR